MTLDILGTTEATGTSAPAVSLGTAANNQPYVHHDCTGAVTLGGTAYDTSEVEITIDNALVVSHYNAQTPGSITPANRTVTLRTVHPYTSGVASALYGVALAGLTTNSVVYTNGGMSTTFTFANLKVPDRTPGVPGKQEITIERTWTAYKDGSTDELVVTHDSVA